MSILVKNIEIPKNCNECKFVTWSNLHQTAACKEHDFEPCFKDHSKEYIEKKTDFCPLVEVPAHEKLIDNETRVKSYKDTVDTINDNVHLNAEDVTAMLLSEIAGSLAVIADYIMKKKDGNTE